MEKSGKSADLETRFSEYRTKLVPYAYNIIGERLEAEDIVQDILNTFFLNPDDRIENHNGYLLRSVVNRSINAKKRLKIRKEKYNGEWLPVPVYTEDVVYREIDKHSILNYSLLVLLERLNPKERAVFILKESFDFGHAEIGEILDVTEEHSRQLFRRARQKLDAENVSLSKSTGSQEEIVKSLAAAILESDVEKVKKLLSDTVQSVSDGGYHHRAARKVISGKDNVCKFLQAMYQKYFPDGATVSLTWFNHQPALVFRQGESIFRTIVFDIRGDVIENVYIIVNPEKLVEIS